MHVLPFANIKLDVLSGYGDTMSVLTLDEDMAMPGLHHDEGYFYTCNIDLPGLPGVFVESVYVGSGKNMF